MPGGKPRLLSSPEEFERKAAQYFNLCALDNRPITWCGLAYFLGFNSRQTLEEYAKRDEYLDVVKRARFRVELSYEERLSGNNVTGAIFVLKNMGWKDTQNIESDNIHKVITSEPLSEDEWNDRYSPSD